MSRATIISMLIALLLGLEGELHAQPQTDQGPIEAGHEALQEAADFPWYDGKQDTIRRMDVYPPKDLAARKSKWQTRPPAAWNWPSWLTYLLQTLGWIVLASLLFTVIWLIARAAMVEGWRSGTGTGSEESLHGDIDRIEALPFHLQRPQTDLLAEARRHYELGNYSEAIIYLYSYQLVQLDRHQLIRLTKGKTNRQYLREVRPRRALFDVLFRSMVAFEDVFFGRHTLGRDQFEVCWRRLDEFHQQLEQAPA